MKKEEKGITLVALIITVIILIILSAITIQTGKQSIRKAQLEGLKTNMLLIQTKAKEFIENAIFDLGVNSDEATEIMKQNAINDLKGKDINIVLVGNDEDEDSSIISELLSIGISQSDIDDNEVYKLTTENLKSMGIQDAESNEEEGWYIIVYNLEDSSVEIYHTIGWQDKYTLTEIEQIEI